MKVSELTNGMVLRLTDTDRLAWVADRGLALRSGDPEIRFVHEFIASLVPGTVIPKDNLIVYLGRVKVPFFDRRREVMYEQLVRRVLVAGKTAVVFGRNFRYLEPHPNFL